MSSQISWQMPNRIEQEYARALRALARQVGAALGDSPDPYAAVRRLRQISQHPPFREYCDAIALKMTTHMQSKVNSTWRAAAREAGRGNDLYAAIFNELKENGAYDAFINTVYKNAELIKSFPLNDAIKLTKSIQSESMKGLRSSEIAKKLLEDYPKAAESQMNLIARTETSKTQTALTQARAERLGLSWYVWRTSKDSRVRNSHEHMDGVLVNWRDPPSPEQLFPQKGVTAYGSYHAGDTFNCRCYPEPVVSLDFLDFPMKVYHNGIIQRMTRTAFERIAA